MRKLFVATAMAAMLGSGSAALAEGSAEAGQQKSLVCAACHGSDGNSANPDWPSLAGQHAGFIRLQLTAFRDGDRQNPLMSPMAIGLSDEDISDLAAFFAAQRPAAREADPDLVEHGQRIFLGGDLERGITACIACHGPTGQGNPLANYPVLAGQHAAYTTAALKAYASGERVNLMMQEIAARMSVEDKQAVSAYLQGLR